MKRKTSSFYALQDFNTNSFCQKLLIFNLALLVSAKPSNCWGDSDCDGIRNEIDRDDDNDGIHDDIDWDDDNDGIHDDVDWDHDNDDLSDDHHGGGCSPEEEENCGGFSSGAGITIILISVFVPLGIVLILIALVCYCGCC